MKSSNPTSNIKPLKTDNEVLKVIVTELQAGTVDLEATVVELQVGTVELEATVAGLEATLAEKNVDIHLLTEQLNLFKALLHARRSEKKLAGKSGQVQLPLFDEAEATLPEEDDEASEEASTEQTPAEETTAVAGHTRKKKGAPSASR